MRHRGKQAGKGPADLGTLQLSLIAPGVENVPFSSLMQALPHSSVSHSPIITHNDRPRQKNEAAATEGALGRLTLVL